MQHCIFMLETVVFLSGVHVNLATLKISYINKSFKCGVQNLALCLHFTNSAMNLVCLMLLRCLLTVCRIPVQLLVVHWNCVLFVLYLKLLLLAFKLRKHSVLDAHHVTSNKGQARWCRKELAKSTRYLCYSLGALGSLSTWLDTLPLLTTELSALLGQLQECGEMLHSWQFQAAANKWSQ